MSHFEKKLSGKRVFEGRIISVDHDEVLLEDGSLAMREGVTHPGGVAVLAAENGYAYFVRQFRYCFGKELLEIPAGKLEPGEDPEKAARRELMEETGLSCKRLELLGCIFPSPGVYAEKLYLYFASGLEKGEAMPDEGEFLTAEKLGISDFAALAAKGGIEDAKTLCAFALAGARGYIDKAREE